MWTFDARATPDGVEFWCRDRGFARHHAVAYTPSFFFSLADPHLHCGLLDAIEERFDAAECTFETVYGPVDGYRVCAGRRAAEAIERETRYAARLYNVDVRREQRYLVERGLFPCAYPGEERFSVDFEVPLSSMHVTVDAPPRQSSPLSQVTVQHDRTETFSGSTRTVVADLLACVEAVDPDLLLFPHADFWIHRIAEQAEESGLPAPFSRTGRFRSIGSRSYWSYGRREYRPAALIPDGRVLIDTEQSFVYREGGVRGVLIASRITGLAPNLAARYTPGTLISAYEAAEALRRGIAVPFRKWDAEGVRGCAELRAADRGGLIFQPDPALHCRVAQIDFTSLYPTIIVRDNLSPETIRAPGRRGFLPEVLEPLLAFRIATKQQKKSDPSCAGIDCVLKWMLVTCFGYTGYKNARFGQIEVHERITAAAREILLLSKEIGEEMGLSVLHGIVDCLWVQGSGVEEFKRRVEAATGISTEREDYDWIVFLPQADGTGACNRYYGRLSGGEVRVRGILARRRDTPAYIREMQRELLAAMGEAKGPADLLGIEERVRGIYRRYRDGLVGADPEDLAIRRRISRLTYAGNRLEGAAVRAIQRHGVEVAPGMEVAFVVRDAARVVVDPAWDAGGIDAGYYGALVEKAWEEVAFAFRCLHEKNNAAIAANAENT
ncbi:MAG TPA: type B DNA-directed DNA polymerase [Methanoculleus sp.]|nr:type B DNA-directed DNA polymerase [Methanoculleus sp.]